MKPAWDKLMKEWNKGDQAKHTVVADVDCTTEKGKRLCELLGIGGFPTIKWGDVSNLEDYKGPREYADLKKFAKEKLKPMCGPANLDVCNDEERKVIKEIEAMPDQLMDILMEDRRKQLQEAGEEYQKRYDELKAEYENIKKVRDEKEAAIMRKGVGLQFMQMVKNNRRLEEKAELKKLLEGKRKKNSEL